MPSVGSADTVALYIALVKPIPQIHMSAAVAVKTQAASLSACVCHCAGAVFSFYSPDLSLLVVWHSCISAFVHANCHLETSKQYTKGVYQYRIPKPVHTSAWETSQLLNSNKLTGATIASAGTGSHN